MTGSKPNIPTPTSCPTRSTASRRDRDGARRLREPPGIYDPADIAIAGVFVSIDADGSLSSIAAMSVPRTSPVPDGDGEADDGEAEADRPGRPPCSAPSSPSAASRPSRRTTRRRRHQAAARAARHRADRHRTLALRDAVAEQPARRHDGAAAQAGLSDTFQRTAPAAWKPRVRHVFFPAQAEDLKDSPPPRRSPSGTTPGRPIIPKDDEALWDWLAALDDASRMALLAHCVSYGVNALYERPNPYSGSRRRSTGSTRAWPGRPAGPRRARHGGGGWRPTVGNYLGRVTKPRILEAVREARASGPRSSSTI
jgi:ParB family chromosome partitioning protein